MAKPGVKAKAVNAKEGGSLPAVLGFAVTALPMAGLLVALWTAPLPAPMRVADPAAAQDGKAVPESGVIYVDLPDPLTVAISANKPRVQITLAVAIKGNLLKLAAMEEDVLAKAQRITAEMLGEAQVLVGEGADSAVLHRDLPERLRRVINGAIGTEDWPEPVAEVLITSMAMQG